MAQGRLPVGPDDKEEPRSNQSPDPQERIGRKIEAVRQILRLEQSKGYSDSVVFGGVDRFLERWVEDPDIRSALERAHISIPSYTALSVSERASWAEETLTRLATLAEAPAASTPPLAPERSVPPADAGLDESPGPSPGQLRRTSRGRPKRAATARPATASASGRAQAAPPPTPTSLEDHLPVPSRMGPGLKRLGIETYRDALWAFPRRYLEVVPLADLTAGQFQAITVSVLRAPRGRYTHGRQLAVTEAVVGDATTSIQAVWFRQAWITRSLKQGARFLLLGRLTEFRGAPRFSVESQEQLSSTEKIGPGDLVPVYPLTQGITQRGMRNVVAPAAIRALSLVREHLPEKIRDAAQLPGLSEALRTIHQPKNADEESRARRRLAFDEMLLLQLGLLERRRAQQSELGAPIPRDGATLKRFLDALPFTLTEDQDRSLSEILSDMERSAPMMRLLQGDVGSGKTVVAAAALVTAAARGYQGALMAPTEVLAEQHFKTLTAIFSQGSPDVSEDAGPYRGFSGILEGRPIRIALLTGSMTAGGKKTLHQLIARGDVDIAIGTHALIQEGVGFQNLGLAIVDEQHRFGVEQRASLRNKGFAPHLLVMTATPIPRTMALAVYGDLDVSTIAQMPPGRPEVRTVALMPEERERAHGFIRREAEAGRQTFVICPLVEESETVEAKAAVAEHKHLSEEVFPDLHVGLLHGRMRPQEKEAVMEQFRHGDLDVLVATAVVEVGIDIPNATVMMIEGAERFGLSQLHQYRGRVGRGTEKSYCILVSDSESPEVRERLALMESTRDGFKLAEADLRLRGPGELLGTRQSGLPDLQVATFGDLSLIEEVRKQALALVAEDPELRQPEHQALRDEMRRFWARASEAPEGG